MSVNRISAQGLEQIINNRVLSPVTCIIKFYSNGCHLCHNLQEYYVDLSDRYELDPKIVFYAYNVDDDPSVEKRLKFDGVPTIVAINPDPDAPPKKRAQCMILEEPEEPHPKTWYKVKNIKEFIDNVRVK